MDIFYKSDYFVDPDISVAKYLPASAFTDKKVLKLETETMFRKSWLLAPCAESSETEGGLLLKQRGAHVPFTMMNIPLFLQRDYKGTLRCFPNTCTHAGYRLIEGPGRPRNRKIVCPQHGREFNTEGACVTDNGFRNMAGFPEECDHLRALPTQEWERFVFMCLGRPVSELEEILAPMRSSMPDLQIGKHEPQKQEERIIEGNWKHHVYNYLDKYHIPFIHRAPGGLSDAVLDYRIETYKYSALQWAYARDPKHGFTPKQLPERFIDKENPDKRVFALWWLIFPNTAFNFYPWGLSVNIFEPMPDNPEMTRFRWYHFVTDEKKYSHRDDWWLSEQVDDEDVYAVRSLSQGVRSPFVVRGRFSPENEMGPHWFHHLVYQFLFEK